MVQVVSLYVKERIPIISFSSVDVICNNVIIFQWTKCLTSSYLSFIYIQLYLDIAICGGKRVWSDMFKYLTTVMVHLINMIYLYIPFCNCWNVIPRCPEREVWENPLQRRAVWIFFPTIESILLGEVFWPLVLVITPMAFLGFRDLSFLLSLIKN